MGFCNLLPTISGGLIHLLESDPLPVKCESWFVPGRDEKLPYFAMYNALFVPTFFREK